MALLPTFLRSPDRFTPRDRRIVLLMSVAAYVQGFAQAQATNTLPFARLSLGLTAGEMSQILAITRFGSVLALAFSFYGDRHGRRGPFLSAFTILILANVATAFVPNPTVYTALQGVVRMAATAVGVLALVYLAEELAPSIRAYGIAIYGGAASFGAGTALFALPVAGTGREAWRYLFAGTAIGVVFLPLLYSRLNESRAFRDPSQRTNLFSALGGSHFANFWVFALISLLAAAFSAVSLTFALERLVNELDIGTTEAVAVMLIGGTAGGIGFLFGGRLADTWGRRPTTMLGFTLSLSGGLGLYWLDSLPLIIAAVAISSLGSFAAVPALGAHRNELFPTSMRATAVVWLNTIGVFGSITGLTIGRFAIDEIGLTMTITYLGAGMLLSTLLILLLPETRGRVLDLESAT
ncbi:MAG: MFS transporter [Acidimicrobiia bacterium]|nr:MFS transporter [Acidimicrobiia bacterium]MDH5615689.1 MFS transporter [Acidimicrobiia bacterium]